MTYNEPRDYTLEGNAAAGGTLPTTGWVTLATITGNTYISRQHAIDLTGYNWFRMTVTRHQRHDVQPEHVGEPRHSRRVAGPRRQLAVSGRLHHRVHLRQRRSRHQRSELRAAGEYGERGLLPRGGRSRPKAGGPRAPRSAWRRPTATARCSTRGYAASPVTTSCSATARTTGAGSGATSTIANFTTMVTAIIALGKVPVIPHVPWAQDTAHQTNAQNINTALDVFYTQHPQVLRGPDLYAVMLNQTRVLPRRPAPESPGSAGVPASVGHGDVERGLPTAVTRLARTTVHLDRDLLESNARNHPGLTKSEIIEEALRKLLAFDASRRLKALGGSALHAKAPRRRRWKRQFDSARPTRPTASRRPSSPRR